MSRFSSDHDSTQDLPEELCLALALYDELVQSIGDRVAARLKVIEKYPAWEDGLQRQFELEDKILGQLKSTVSPPWEAPSNYTRFVPRYRLGVGGQGEVWLAHDPELDRFVAIKIVRESDRGSQKALRGIWQEAELTGQLEHPNIVPVYDAARASGSSDQSSPYYVMRVYGNRHLLKAIAAYYARERQSHDMALLQAINAFHHDRSSANELSLEQVLATFPFDDTHECDRQLRDAVAALRNDSRGHSGRNLEQAIRAYHREGRRPAEFRDLLNRFIDVCNALAYAHSRGVIHRDLKPQNVMLGEFGETLVVDWGMARQVADHHSQERPAGTSCPLHEASAENDATQEGSAKGTPQYMSPEQAAGRNTELTTATDIYSLGGILYAILTGKPPRHGTSQAEILQVAREGKISAPSLLLPDVHKPLEAVCLKALSKSPADRYLNANDLATDITRWLADEPVTAWREPILVRSQRWVRRHQTLVTTAAAIVMISTLGLGVFTGILNDKNSQLQLANDQLDGKNQELLASNARETTARLLADENAEEAERQRNIAVDQSELVLTSLKDVVYDLQRGLNELPAGSSVRQRLLATSIRHLEALARSHVERSEHDRTTMAAMSDLARLMITFGVESDLEGEPLRVVLSALGMAELEPARMDLARQLLLKSHQVALRILEENPEDSQARRDLALKLNDLGDLHVQMRLPREAVTYYEEAMLIRSELASRTPPRRDAGRELAISWSGLASAYVQLGRTTEAEELYQRVFDFMQRLAGEQPENVNALRDFSIAAEDLAHLQLQLGSPQAALGNLREALEIRRRLREWDPDSAETQRDLAVALGGMGNATFALGDSPGALDYFQQALEVRIELADLDPENLQLLRELAIAHNMLGNVHAALGESALARGEYSQALEAFSTLAFLDAGNPDSQRDLSIAHDSMGGIAGTLGEWREARQHYQQAFEIRSSLLQMMPDDPQKLRDVSVSIIKLGDASHQLGELEQALTHYKAFVGSSATLSEMFPDSREARHDLGVAYTRLADISLALGDAGEALLYNQQAYELREQLAAAYPDDPETLHDFHYSANVIGETWFEWRCYAEAVPYFEQALQTTEQLAAGLLPHPDDQEYLWRAHSRLANVMRRNLEFSGARHHAMVAMTLVDGLIESGLQSTALQRERASLESRIAAVDAEETEAEFALGDWEAVMQRADPVPVLVTRITLLGREERFDEIPQAAQALHQLAQSDAELLYHAASGYALCAAAAPQESESPDSSQTLSRDRCADLAVQCLAASLEAGFRDFERLRHDPDLSVLRDFPAFEELLHTPPPPPVAQ